MSSTPANKPELLSDRLPYSAIVDRPPLRAPDGARLLVWVIVNVEHWSIERAMPRTVLSPPMGQPLLPDLPNWAWHEYGMRVGFWRLHDALVSRGIVPTMAINGIVCESYPRIAKAALSAGWEFMGHGWVQGPMHKVEDQAQIGGRTLCGAHAGDRRIAQGQLIQPGSQLGAIDVDDDAVGCGQGEHAVLHRTGKIEDQAGVIRRAPQAHAADFRGGQHVDGQRRQHDSDTAEQRTHAHSLPHLS